MMANLMARSKSDAAEGEKKVRTRKSHRKVRSGCITCKIRRKKCDENKPSCLRCTSTGRKCDGYEPVTETTKDEIPRGQQPPSSADPRVWGYTSDAERSNTRNDTGTLETIARQPAQQLFVSDLDLQCFDYFRMVTAQQLGNYHDSSIWRSFVVRAAMIHPVILKATAALGAVHRRHDLGISKEAFQYCEIAERLDGEAVRALNDFQTRGSNQPYSKEVVMMAKMLRGVFLTFQGEFQLAAASMAYGLASLWDRPLKTLGSSTQKYGSRVHSHVFTDLFKRLGNYGEKILGRKYVVLTDPHSGVLPPIPYHFPALLHAFDLLYTQIEHLYNIPTSIWQDTQKRIEVQTMHVQFLLRWNAALAETNNTMSTRTNEQIQASSLLRRIRSTIYLLVYIILFLQSDTKRKSLDFEALKKDMLSEEDSHTTPFSKAPCSAIDVASSITYSISHSVGSNSDTQSDVPDTVIASANLWKMVNSDEDLLTNISGIAVLVESLVSNSSTFDYHAYPYTMSMNVDSGIGPPRSNVPLPANSAKVRHLIRALLQPSSLDKIYSDTYAEPFSSALVPPPEQGAGVSYGRIYNIAEQVCALEEYAVLAAAGRSRIVPEGVQPRWLDVTCFLEERKMLVRYCSRDTVEGAGPDGGMNWTQEWVQM